MACVTIRRFWRRLRARSIRHAWDEHAAKGSGVPGSRRSLCGLDGVSSSELGPDPVLDASRLTPTGERVAGALHRRTRLGRLRPESLRVSPGRALASVQAAAIPYSMPNDSSLMMGVLHITGSGSKANTLVATFLRDRHQ